MLTVKKVIERYEPHKPAREDYDSKEVMDAWRDSWRHISQALWYAKATEVFAEEFTTLKKGWDGELAYSEIEEQKIGTFLCGDGKQAGENLTLGREGIEYFKQVNILGIVMHGSVSLRKCDFYDVEKWARYIKMADAHNNFVDAIQVMMRHAGIIGNDPETFFNFVVEHPECKKILSVHVEEMREMLSDLVEFELQEVGI